MSLQQGLQAKAEGQARAESGASEWSTQAMECILDLAKSGAEFTSEDVTNIVGLPSRSTGMNENNAVGSVFSHAARKGHIEWTGRLNKSTREERHASDLRVWRKPTPENPFLNLQADTVRRLAALATKGLEHLTDPDADFVLETKQMIADTRSLLVASHQ